MKKEAGDNVDMDMIKVGTGSARNVRAQHADGDGPWTVDMKHRSELTFEHQLTTGHRKRLETSFRVAWMPGCERQCRESNVVLQKAGVNLGEVAQ